MKVISNHVMFAFYVFVAFVAFTHDESKELEGNYTPVSNNNIEQIRTVDVNSRSELTTESNTEWGSIADPSY